MPILDLLIREKSYLINAENIVKTEEWEELKKKIGRGYEWYILTPVNFKYNKVVSNLELEREVYNEILGNRLNILSNQNEKINLLIHLNKIRSFLTMEKQERKFHDAINFFSAINIHPKKFISIDNVYDSNTILIAQSYGLKSLEVSEPIIKLPLLKILNLAKIKISFANKFQSFLRKRDFKSIIFLIMGELYKVKIGTIHAEIFVHDEIWESLLEKAIGKGFIWFVITPSNYEYCSAYFELSLDKKEFSRILKERIMKLRELGEEVQLHIHLSKYRTHLDYEMQQKKFKEAIEFLKALDIHPSKIAAGWWIYDINTIKIARSYGIKEIHDYSINPKKKSISKNGIKIRYVHKYWHDFDFL